MTDSEWTPWNYGTPNGCPYRVGDYVGIDVVIAGQDFSSEGYLTESSISSLCWSLRNAESYLVRHRLRKPKGLRTLERIAKAAELCPA